MNRKEFAAMLDHTILKPDATKEDVRAACKVAMEAGCATIAVNGCDVKFASILTQDSATGVDVGFGGFPLGRVPTSVKIFEASEAVKNGATELDMIMNVGAFKECSPDYLLNEVSKIVEIADGRIVKVILETSLLSDTEKVKAAKICADAGADFVKTSTGFGSAGATPHDVALLRDCLPDHVKIKASGGIRSWADAKALIDAGADRLGTSATLKILAEFDAENPGK